MAAATGPCGSSRFIGKPLAVGRSPGREPSAGKAPAANAATSERFLHCKAQRCPTGRPQHAISCEVNDMHAGATPFSPAGAIANLHENNRANGARAGE
ncbi:hypothetical protein E4K64_03825 [Bradyrhizobium frederickii]|uniref:Uncharacterized protein n=1 Tax=Bradyrhizobium frederickii TaxID=2560054 RepID=A0A4Y9PHZ4_9BRAD|nr:hypothetical protein E4K64_03825 [Bradyrhizobium frederickii]